MNHYRRIWIAANGPIPVDENGVSYEIHHKDGNRENNELTNLQCLSIIDHFNIHFEQGDFQASLLILEKIGSIRGLAKLGYTPKTLAAYMVENELGLWDKEAKQRAIQTKRDRQSGACFNKAVQSAAGKKGGPIGARITNEIHKANCTGFYSSENQRKFAQKAWSDPKRMAASMTGIPKVIVTCPHCGKSGGGQALMNRWHFANCKTLIGDNPELMEKRMASSRKTSATCQAKKSKG